jgi:serine/threonine protein kinase/Tfp pilus assembly protein PilF
MDVAQKKSTQLKAVAARICLTCHRQFQEGMSHCPTDGTMLLTPPPDPIGGSALAEQYEVEGMIGSGGWSLVYRARQRSLGRPVAIKILHSHLVLDPDKVMRFQREAEAASKFNHPSIPSVYDFGSLPNGQPYMVMAYVDGRSLAEIIAEDGPMSIDDALDIFSQTAAGLSVAHERGIIHRDVKPSNILLTKEKREVKILDFGLAKLIDSGDGKPLATLTQAGHTIGTPAYMSPEQCLGLELDARSDLYSLGCVMFETITGIRLFEGKDAFEAMNLHMRGDVSFENTKIKDTIPEGVEAMILRSLAKNPQDRYQTADELHRALESLKKQTAVGPNPFRFLQPLQRAFAKNKAKYINTAATVGVTAAVIGTLVIAAVRSVDFVKQPGAPRQNLAEAYSDAMARGERQFFAGNFPMASSHFRQAADLAENFGASDSRLNSSLKKLQDSLAKEGKKEEVQKVTEHIEALKNSTYGLMYGTAEQNARHIIALTAKREANPNDVDLARQLCAVLNNQAALMFTQNNVGDAKQFLDRAIEIEKKMLGENDPEYATSLSNLAYYQSQRGDKAEAEKLYTQALELRQKVLGSSDPKVGRSLRNLADFYWQQGDPKRAQQLMTQSMEVYKKQLPKTAADYAWTTNNLGLIYAAQRNYAEARKLFNEALDMRKQLYGDTGLDVGRTLHNLAQLDTAEQRYSEAEEEFRTAQKIYDTKLGTEHPDSLKCVSNLALMYFNKGNYADAEPLFKRILGIMRESHPSDPMVTRAHNLLAQIYQKQNRRDALDELEKTSPKHE